VTAAKVRFVYRADAAAAFGELFDASVLPASLGGALERPAPVRLPAQPALLAPCPGAGAIMGPFNRLAPSCADAAFSVAVAGGGRVGVADGG